MIARREAEKKAQEKVNIHSGTHCTVLLESIPVDLMIE